MKKTKGKVLLHSPYLDILGGGERHILSILQVFDRQGYEIDLAWNDTSIRDRIHRDLHIKFKNLNIVDNFFLNSDKISKAYKTSRYDYFFYVTDGSYFISRARHNYIFAMYPRKSIYNMKFINRLKLLNFSVISNSEFTAKYVDRWVGKKPKVIHPYISDDFFALGRNHHRKEKIILTVGRFFEHLHSKRHDVLIEAFIKLKKRNEYKDYILVIAGGLKMGEDNDLIAKLRKLVKGRNDIQIITNVPFKKIIELYEKASIYWHAAGYGIDEQKEPQRVEHLGITPLEAMASGCYVFCHNSGGPKQFIKDGFTGYLYNSIEELVEKTETIIKHKNLKLLNEASEFVRDNFSYDVFEKGVIDFFKIK